MEWNESNHGEIRRFAVPSGENMVILRFSTVKANGAPVSAPIVEELPLELWHWEDDFDDGPAVPARDPEPFLDRPS